MPNYADGGTVNLDQENYTYNGKRLTEQSAAKLGAKIAKRAKRAGRPSLASGTSPQIALRVTPATKTRLQRIATARKVPVSEIHREAIEEYLSAHTE